jgi:DNA-directed RNA polymerase I, II, and III subunit RPABC1
MDERDISRLAKVYKTVHEMVSDRGYMVASTELEMSLNDFTQKYSRNGVIDRQILTFLVEHSTEQDQLLVFFSEEETVGIKPIRRICERMVNQGIMKGILIYQKNLTPSASKVVQEMAPKYQLELFQESELLVNITKHILVPEHQVLIPEAKKILLNR